MPHPFRILITDNDSDHLHRWHHILSSGANPAYPVNTAGPLFEITDCATLKEAIQLVGGALAENRPYAMVFINVHEATVAAGTAAAREIRALDPQIELVILTDFPVGPSEDLSRQIPPWEKISIYKKAFFMEGAYHITRSLCIKWRQERDLARATSNLKHRVGGRAHSPDKGAAATIKAVRGTTHQNRDKANLEHQMQFLQTVLDTIPNPVFYKNTEGRYTGCNRSFEDFIGKPKAEIIGHTVYDMGPPKSAEKYQEKDKELFENPGKQQYEWKLRHSSGAMRDVIFNKATFSNNNGKIEGLIGVISDITQRKKSEKALKESKEKLQALYFRLVDAQEQERKRIAMELHDDFGQTLILLKLQLGNIRKRLHQENSGLCRECETIIENTQQLIEKTRNLFHGLTPLTLHDMGLRNALQSLTKTFSTHSDLRITLQGADIEKELTAKAKIIVYRIFQEVLSNIQKHAGADLVKIVIEKHPLHAVFVIEDNGRGFRRDLADGSPPEAFGLGLTSMDERVRMLGGRFELNSRLNVGTQIKFTVPFRAHFQ